MRISVPGGMVIISRKTITSIALVVSALSMASGCNDNVNLPAPQTPAPPAQQPGSVPPASGATLSCASSGKNAWLTYGESAFVAVNESIFTNVENLGATTSTSTPLGPSFTLVGSGNPPSTQDNLATFKGNLAAFLVYLYGGPTQITYTDGVVYQGPQSMQDAHRGLNITTAEFNYFVSSVIVPALTSNGVSAEDIASCFAPPLVDPTFVASVVGQ